MKLTLIQSPDLNFYTMHCWFTIEGFVFATFKSRISYFLLMKIGCSSLLIFTERFNRFRRTMTADFRSLMIRKGLIGISVSSGRTGLTMIESVSFSGYFSFMKLVFRFLHSLENRSGMDNKW